MDEHYTPQLHEFHYMNGLFLRDAIFFPMFVSFQIFLLTNSTVARIEIMEYA